MLLSILFIILVFYYIGSECRIRNALAAQLRYVMKHLISRAHSRCATVLVYMEILTEVCIYFFLCLFHIIISQSWSHSTCFPYATFFYSTILWTVFSVVANAASAPRVPLILCYVMRHLISRVHSHCAVLVYARILDDVYIFFPML